MPSFQAIATVLGLLLIVGALASGLAQRSFLSLTALFVLAGFALGPGGLGKIDFRPHSGFVEDLAFAALIVILFRDGLEVEGEMLKREWHLPARKLVVAMPITAAIVAAAAHLLFGLSWTESFLLGALLSPTDPVLTSSIVTNARVPRLIRHSLNLESGLNDGLALPAVLALLAALSTSSGSFVWWRFVIQDLGLGLLYGLACGWLASLLMPRPRASSGASAGIGATSDAGGRASAGTGTGVRAPAGKRGRGQGRDRSLEHSIPAHQKSLFALGVAFATYGLTVLSPEGNGFIAVFVAAIVLGIRRPDLRQHFERRADELVEIVKLGIFFVFGSLLTLHALTREGWPSLAFVAVVFLLARPLAVWIALLGTTTDRATRLFMGWFGPKGVATMTFALLVLDENIASGPRIFDLTALVVFCSIIVHGLSDTPGANWIADHAAAAQKND
jgi:NhaP-type Na+/H+ or K+/H+ antiporter